MTNRLLAGIAVGSVLGLAACGQKPDEKSEVAVAPTAPAAAPAGGMASMTTAAAPAEKMGKGAGTVTVLDKTAGAITISHGPIPEIGWPAMTMAFKAAPSVTESVKVGDKVAFDLTLRGKVGEITAIRPQ